MWILVWFVFTRLFYSPPFASWIYDLSANRKPVKMATAVSPIEALGYRSASKLKKQNEQEVEGNK